MQYRTYTDRRADRIILILSLVIALFLTTFLCGRIDAAARTEMQEHLADEVLRFHVLANSDSEEDQTLKMLVRDEVLEYLKRNLPEGLDVNGTKDWVRRHADQLEETGRRTVAENGYDYPVSAAVTTVWFPDRTYGDVTFPAGNYEALRIEIGAAQGRNWWCVLYPNLCFMDTVHAVVPEEGKKKLKDVLTEEEYAQVTAGSEFRIKFFFLDR